MNKNNFVFGKKSILENLNTNKIKFVNFQTWNNEIISILKQKNIPFKVHSDSTFFKQFDPNLNHQGIIAEIFINNKISSIEEISQSGKKIILILDSLEDPQNFGAILRTCDAFAVDAIVYKKDNQVQINDFVVKTSLGAINNLNLIKVSNISNAIQKLKEKGFWIYSSVLNEKSQNIYKTTFDQKTVLIVGNENKGISKIVLENSDFLINIPMYGSVQSLNVSVATGIILSEIKKQHNI